MQPRAGSLSCANRLGSAVRIISTGCRQVSFLCSGCLGAPKQAPSTRRGIPGAARGLRDAHAVPSPLQEPQLNCIHVLGLHLGGGSRRIIQTVLVAPLELMRSYVLPKEAKLAFYRNSLCDTFKPMVYFQFLFTQVALSVTPEFVSLIMTVLRTGQWLRNALQFRASQPQCHPVSAAGLGAPTQLRASRA